MSGGKDRKSRSSKAQGWEEAGGEFYQESYPGDLENLQRDPASLATLLPSKQNRAATTRRVRPNSQDTKNTRRRPGTATGRRRSSQQVQPPQSTANRRNSQYADVQVSMLPDLSQDLTDEERIWEEIMEIKTMPVSMAQKREMKAQLQNTTTLRLKGFDQIKWQRRKVWQQFVTKWSEMLNKMELWRYSLKRIEGNFGTGVVAYFLFLRWLMFLNLVIFILIFSFIVIPHTALQEPKDKRCDLSNNEFNSTQCCFDDYMNRSLTYSVLDIIQGTGFMERTLMFYGMYTNKIFGYHPYGSPYKDDDDGDDENAEDADDMNDDINNNDLTLVRKFDHNTNLFNSNNNNNNNIDNDKNNNNDINNEISNKNNIVILSDTKNQTNEVFKELNDGELNADEDVLQQLTENNLNNNISATINNNNNGSSINSKIAYNNTIKSSQEPLPQAQAQQQQQELKKERTTKSSTVREYVTNELYYDLPLAYVSVTAVYFLLSLAAIVKSASREFKDRLVDGEGQFYQYCNLIFGGWDFCIHNEKSADIKHKALYNEIKSLLYSKRLEYERHNRSRDYMCKLIMIRLIVNIFVILILMLSAFLIYYLFNVSLHFLEPTLKPNEPLNLFPKLNLYDEKIMIPNNNEFPQANPLVGMLYNKTNSIPYLNDEAVEEVGLLSSASSSLSAPGDISEQYKAVHNQQADINLQHQQSSASILGESSEEQQFNVKNYESNFIDKKLASEDDSDDFDGNAFIRRSDAELLFNRRQPDLVKQLETLFYEFLPYIAIVCLNLLVPVLFNYLCEFEQYTPMFVIKISLFRTVFLRLSSLAVLLSRFYFIIIPKTDDQCVPQKGGTPQCWETFVGQQFYKLLITDFVTHILVTFFINFPRSLIAKHVKTKFARLVGEQEFELTKHVLDVVYSQTLCWLGAFYAPFLPAIATILTFFMFYIKKFQCLVNSKPSIILYRASRSNSLFMFILLLSFVIAIVPVVYAIAEIKPSRSCGPFRGLNSVWDAAIESFMKMPLLFQNFIFFLGTAGFAIPCFIVLTLFLYYYYAVSDANKHMVEVLKNQLVLEGHDKQFLLNRLSSFIKQQQEFQKKMRQYDPRMMESQISQQQQHQQQQQQQPQSHRDSRDHRSSRERNRSDGIGGD